MSQLRRPAEARKGEVKRKRAKVRETFDSFLDRQGTEHLFINDAVKDLRWKHGDRVRVTVEKLPASGRGKR